VYALYIFCLVHSSCRYVPGCCLKYVTAAFCVSPPVLILVDPRRISLYVTGGAARGMRVMSPSKGQQSGWKINIINEEIWSSALDKIIEPSTRKFNKFIVILFKVHNLLIILFQQMHYTVFSVFCPYLCFGTSCAIISGVEDWIYVFICYLCFPLYSTRAIPNLVSVNLYKVSVRKRRWRQATTHQFCVCFKTSLPSKRVAVESSKSSMYPIYFHNI
jgi:hypothetical protein